MDFTSNELYLIERTMDNLCAEHLKGVMQYIHTIEHLEGDMKKEGQRFIQNELKQWVKTHDTFKTICAKCEQMRTPSTQTPTPTESTHNRNLTENLQDSPKSKS